MAKGAALLLYRFGASKVPVVEALVWGIFGASISTRGNALNVSRATFSGGGVDLVGSGNEVSVGGGQWTSLRDSNIVIHGNNNRVVIGEGCSLISTDVEIHGDNCLIEIGSLSTFNGKPSSRNLLLCRDAPTELLIGRDGMFSHGIEARTSDSHSMFDSAGHLANPPASIELGAHVWVCARAMVLKGSKVGAGSVIGAAAILNRTIDPDSLAAGQPAKTIRSGIRWTRESLSGVTTDAL